MRDRGRRPDGAEREFDLRAAAEYHARELLYRGADRSAVLERVRAKAPGLPEERYEAALSDAVALLERLRRSALDRRARDIAEARRHHVLDAVFALHYANRRYRRQHLDDGLAPIGLHEVLGDLWPADDIDAARARADALIEDGSRYGWESQGTTAHLGELAARHPGFGPSSLQAALDWGYQQNR